MAHRMDDTIAAIATGIGSAGIGIVRLSGPGALEVADLVFKCKTPLSEGESHRVYYGHVMEGGRAIDEALATVFRAPRSYTREDVVELSCHGGAFILRRALSAVLSAGARLAEPGEFTKRAFLNGRIDLAQAESVMDLIASDNERALSNSLRQLDGALSEEARRLREEIIHECAFIEAALDDPEHYDLDGYPGRLAERAALWRKSLSALIDSSKQGRILRDGIRTAIVGRPNAGKSSLLNALAREERAIVTEIAGTTRDTIEEKARFEDLTLALVDTAGIRDTEDLIEQIGVKRSLLALEESDLILYLVDVEDGFTDEDLPILEKLDYKKTILVFNKRDLMPEDRKTDGEKRPGGFIEEAEEFLKNHGHPASLAREGVFLSAKKGEGLHGLAEAIRSRFGFGIVDNSVDIFVANERHAALLREADVGISHVENSIACGLPEDFFTGDLMEAYASLGAIIGEEVEDDLVDQVFRKFCMGK